MRNARLRKRIQKIFEYVTSKLPCLICNIKMINSIRAPFYIRPRGAKFLNPALVSNATEVEGCYQIVITVSNAIVIRALHTVYTRRARARSYDAVNKGKKERKNNTYIY